MKHLIYTTFIHNSGYTFDEYVNNCRENELPIPTEEDSAYYSWARELLDMDFDDMFDNIKYSQYNKECYIKGSLGLWTGRVDIKPVECDDLVSAIRKCIKGQDDCEIYVDGNAVYVNAYNHDSQYHGCNKFKIVIKGMKIKDGYLY